MKNGPARRSRRTTRPRDTGSRGEADGRRAAPTRRPRRRGNRDNGIHQNSFIRPSRPLRPERGRRRMRATPPETSTSPHKMCRTPPARRRQAQHSRRARRTGRGAEDRTRARTAAIGSGTACRGECSASAPFIRRNARRRTNGDNGAPTRDAATRAAVVRESAVVGAMVVPRRVFHRGISSSRAAIDTDPRRRAIRRTTAARGRPTARKDARRPTDGH